MRKGTRKHMGPRTLAAGVALLEARSRDPEAWVPPAEVARRMQLSYQTARNALAKLAELGAAEVHTRVKGTRRQRRYRLTPEGERMLLAELARHFQAR